MSILTPTLAGQILSKVFYADFAYVEVEFALIRYMFFMKIGLRK